MDSKEPGEKLVAQVDEGRRAAVRRFIGTAAFAAPVVASFSLSGLGTNEAHAYAVNTTRDTF